jgi:hypothetical protein
VHDDFPPEIAGFHPKRVVRDPNQPVPDENPPVLIAADCFPMKTCPTRCPHTGFRSRTSSSHSRIAEIIDCWLIRIRNTMRRHEKTRFPCATNPNASKNSRHPGDRTRHSIPDPPHPSVLTCWTSLHPPSTQSAIICDLCG